MTEPRERREITPRSAAEVEDDKRGAASMCASSVDVLAHVVIARAFPERLRTLRVTLERLREIRSRSSRRSNGSAVPFSGHSRGGPVRRLEENIIAHCWTSTKTSDES